jgi:O-antigen polymerase
MYFTQEFYALLLTLIFPLLLSQKPSRKFQILIILVIFSILLILQSRTGTIACAVLFFVDSWHNGNTWFNKKNRVVVSMILLIGITYLFFIKSASTSGRFFIYTNGLQILKKNLPWGIGLGNYNPVFNHHQAAYFANHSITSNKAMLANDGYFAMNEYLQAGIELGIPGLAIMLLWTALVLRKGLSIIRRKDTQGFYPFLFLLAIFIHCLFYYPLHFNAILFASLVATYLLFVGSIKSYMGRYFIKLKLFGTIFLIVGVIIYAVNGLQYLMATQKWKMAKQDLNEGYKLEAIKNMEKFQHTLHREYGFNYSLATAYYVTGQTKAAISKLEYGHKYECNQMHHQSLGLWYDEMGDSAKAIDHLKLSLYITPQLLQSRLHLMDFYLNHKDTFNAFYWAKQIIDCPIKIPNTRAYKIKELAQEFLQHKAY